MKKGMYVPRHEIESFSNTNSVNNESTRVLRNSHWYESQDM
jgi:hypothetical protein